MCGRLNITDDPLALLVSEMLGIDFKPVENTDLCPSQEVATIVRPPQGFTQVNANWGIQPNWSNKLLINAQSETAHEKSTFKAAFSHSRCLIPCSGWYEWKTQNNQKVKYLFSHTDNTPFYMGGILFDQQDPKLVTLTTAPNEACAEIHHRMPVIIKPTDIDYWFNAEPEALTPVFDASSHQDIAINACK